MGCRYTIRALLFPKTLLFKSQMNYLSSSATESIKTHNREKIHQTFSTRFFNRGLIVIDHKTEPPSPTGLNANNSDICKKTNFAFKF